MVVKKSELIFGIFLFTIVLILKYPVLNLPYYWDGLNYIASTVDYLQNNFIDEKLLDYNLGHPIFFPLLISILFKIFGSSIFLANFTVVIFSFLTLFWQSQEFLDY